MQVRQTVRGEWENRMATIKRRIRLSEKMLSLRQNEDSHSYWHEYRKVLVKRLHNQFGVGIC